METLIQEHKALFNEILEIVSQYFDLNKDLVLKCKSEEYTDSRYITIRILADYFSDKEISNMTGLTRMGVNRIRNKFISKISKRSLQQSYSRLKDKTKHLFEL